MISHYSGREEEGSGPATVDDSMGKGLRQVKVFLVGKLFTGRDYNKRLLMCVFKTIWSLNGCFRIKPEDGGRVLFTFSDPNDRTRVWKGGP
ncbi:hypothetical protein ACLB2K_015673 [Fragaria x ananassa]